MSYHSRIEAKTAYATVAKNSRRISPTPMMLRREVAHQWIEIRFLLEPDSRNVGQTDLAVHHGNVVGKSSERLEDTGIRLVAAEPEPGRHVERHLMPAVGDDGTPAPPVLLQHGDRPQVF